MTNNLFVSYDLYQPGQAYEDVARRIKSLGVATKVHKSLWYVNSKYTPEVAAKHIWEVMDRNDTVLVIDASHNTFYGFNIDPAASKVMQSQWYAMAA